METLESYLSSEFIAQDQEVRALDRTICSVAEMFTVVGKKGGWPYGVKLDDLRNPMSDLKTANSPGTIAMILSSVGVLTGDCQSLSGSSADLAKFGDQRLKTLWEDHFKNICSSLSDAKEIPSATFGKNNILTISHFCEFIETLSEEEHKKIATKEFNSILVNAVCAAFKGGVDDALAHSQTDEADEPSQNDEADKPRKPKYQKNAFILLRAMRSKMILQSKDRIPDLKTIDLKPFMEYFESTLHDHLSFSSIPDSRFDPAELIFCLEGLLLCSREAVDTTLLKRVLEVLSDKQSANSHWRANKPFLTGATGAIHLPLSVEGANSLMRSIAIMDEHRHFNTYTAMALPLIARFWTWLRARSVRSDFDGKACVGWHSEHVNTPDVIDLWDTAMVAEFMYSYREMLGRHMADKSLHLAGLSIVRPSQEKDNWTDTCKSFEPLLDDFDEKHVKVYNEAKIDFIDGWLKGIPENFSILLYGPPGTGKSTFAENMAKALGFPFITVTVSDFLGSGGANVESRAKAVFKTLEMQKDCVILFDEIDSFLLDRNSKRYGEQDSLFQFLTPGMLTKVNDLRKLERSIFIIATNYEKRIDAAIKRTGRIDKKYLLGLPNAARRAKMLGLGDDGLQGELKKISVLFAFSDLVGAKKDAAKTLSSTDDKFQDEIADKLKDREAATSVKAYLDLSNADEIFPGEELIGLLTLIEDAYGDEKCEALNAVETTGNTSCLSKKITGLLKGLGFRPKVDKPE